MYNITHNHVPREFNGIKISQRANDGYLDATAMCQATGKLFGNYKQLNSTQQFLTALSTDIGYPISEIIQVVKGGDPGRQGTWIHPKAAIHLAQWCSPEFAVLVSKWVFELLTTGSVDLQPQASQSKMLEHARINRELMQIFGIESNMQVLALNNAMREEFGVNLLETWGVNGLKADTQDQLLTPSDIAVSLGIGRRKVNPILIEVGLQTSNRDHKDRLYYELTDKGLEHGIYLDTSKRHSDGTPVRQIKWYASVIDVLKAQLEADFVLEGGVA